MGPQSQHYGYYGEQKKQFPFKIVALILGAVVLLVIAISVIGTVLKNNGVGVQAQHLSVRLANLNSLTAAGTGQLTNPDLRKLNAETAIITDGVSVDMSSIVVDTKKIDKSILSAESDTSDTTKLDAARLDGTYDSVYAKVLQQRLESMNAIFAELYAKTNSSSLRHSLDSDTSNYQAILTNLQKVTI